MNSWNNLNMLLRTGSPIFIYVILYFDQNYTEWRGKKWKIVGEQFMSFGRRKKVAVVYIFFQILSAYAFEIQFFSVRVKQTKYYVLSLSICRGLKTY